MRAAPLFAIVSAIVFASARGHTTKPPGASATMRTAIDDHHDENDSADDHHEPVNHHDYRGWEDEDDLGETMSSGLLWESVTSSQQVKTYEVMIDTKLRTWFKSLLHCVERHGNLASVQSEKELIQLVNTINDTLNNVPGKESMTFWIGGTNQHSERGYYWFSDGRQLSINHWAENNPTKRTTDKENNGCIQIVAQPKEKKWTIQKWTNDGCKSTKIPICEYY